MKGELLTIDDLENAMMEEYRQLTRNQSKPSGMEGELLLFGQGMCYTCGSSGHRANECPKRKDGAGNQGKTYRFQYKCNNCGVKGHKSRDCWNKEENKNKRPANWKKKETEKAALSVDREEIKAKNGDTQIEYGWINDDLGVSLLDPTIWIADTGATVHSTSSNRLAKNWSKGVSDTVVVMGNGNREFATKVGDVEGSAINNNGNKQGRIKLSEVLYLPNGKYNLLSVTKVMKSGWKLSGNKDEISLEKGNRQLTFNIKIYTSKGTLYAVKINPDDEVVATSSDQSRQSTPKTKMTVSEAHGCLGHLSRQKTIETARNLGWELKGTFDRCEYCAIGKGRQKSVVKASNHIVASKPGERIFLDIAAVFEAKEESEYVESTRKMYWRIMVDELTQYKISDFFVSKKAMIEPTCEKLFKLNVEGKNVKYIRCDDGGENRGLMNRLQSSDWKLPIRFEFTGRDTPQRNHLAEVALSTIAGRGRAIMSAAKIPKNMRHLFWREAFQTATLMDGLIMVEVEGNKKTRFEHWEGQLPRFVKYLKQWGEAGVVKLHNSTTPKIYDRGKTCMLVGYSTIHAGDTYRMWDPDSQRVHLSRDVVWTGKMYFSDPEWIDKPFNLDFGKVPEIENLEVIDGVNKQDDDDDEVGKPIDDNVEEADDEDIDVQRRNEEKQFESNRTRSGRVIQKPARFRDNYGSVLIDVSSNCDEIILIGAGIGEGIKHTAELHVLNYKNAMKGPDKDQWEKAIAEEHNRMVENKVWVPIEHENMDKNVKILSSTWAMKKKANGQFRARITARGYLQEDGIHYFSDSTTAPVTNETTIKIIFVLLTMSDWAAHVVDVRGAFLKGRFANGEEMYLKVPDGFQKFYKKGVVLKLERTIYGLKQAAYEFWKELLLAFKAMGFEKSVADPCLYFKNTLDGLVLWISWVDDCLLVGHPNQVREYKQKMNEYFDCDDVGELREYVGCKVERNKKEGIMKMTQPVLIKSFVDKFDIPHNNQLVIPASQGESFAIGGHLDMMDEEDQRRYRSGVGKLLYLSKWSRPDILNITRELSRHFMTATKAHEKAMKRVMAYCIDTKEKGVVIKPKGKWTEHHDSDNFFEIVGISDSDYAKDRKTRRSVTGYVVFLNGALVAARSKMQECVTLSVTEAELVAATNCVQDMIYVKNVLGSIGLEVKLPMRVMVDNKGAKDIVNNWSVRGRTRHVGVRFHFLRELKDKGEIEVNWISTEMNCADILTKNLPAMSYVRHADTLCEGLFEKSAAPGEGVEMRIVKSECAEPVQPVYGSHKVTSDTIGKFDETSGKFQKIESVVMKPNISKS